MTSATKMGVSVLVVASAAFAACGGAQNPNSGYSRFDCGGEIGTIVREDCSQSAIKYDGKVFEGSLNTPVGGASAKASDVAVRQASELVQVLNQQASRLCSDFNGCRLTLAEYNAERRRLDDSYVALTALRGQMAQLDAEQATKLLAALSKIRSDTVAKSSSGCPEPIEIPFTKDSPNAPRLGLKGFPRA